MKRNYFPQNIVAQMITRADGTDYTTPGVVVWVYKDGTGPLTGSGGAPNHVYGGCWRYVPTIEETDAAHVAFIFVGTGAITTTVQVYPTYPQSGDSFERLGMPRSTDPESTIAGDIEQSRLSIEAAVAAVDTSVIQTYYKTVEVDTTTDKILTAMELDGAVYRFTANALELGPVGGGGGGGDATSANQATIIAKIDAVKAETALIQAKTTNLPSDPADASVVAGQITAVSTKVDAVKVDTAAVKAKTDRITYSVGNAVDGNITHVNSRLVGGTGAPGAEWGPA